MYSKKMIKHNVYSISDKDLSMQENKPNPVGCPPKCTPERLAAILNSVSRRVPYEFAAEANGISEATLYNWLNIGKADREAGNDTPLAKFLEDLKKIEHDKIAHHSDKIDANVERWQADAWLLERRFYKHYGANVHLHELEDRMKQVEENGKKKEVVNGQEA